MTRDQNGGGTPLGRGADRRRGARKVRRKPPSLSLPRERGREREGGAGREVRDGRDQESRSKSRGGRQPVPGPDQFHVGAAGRTPYRRAGRRRIAGRAGPL